MLRLVSLLLFMATSAQAQDYASRPDKLTSQFQIELRDAKDAGTLGGAPSSVQLRSISSLGLALIIHFEGSVLDSSGIHVPYNDAAQFCTIGYGHLIAKGDCAQLDLGGFKHGISDEWARQLLADDLRFARLAVQTYTKYDDETGGGSISLSTDEFSALLSFIYNVGDSNFARSTLLRRLKQDLKDLAAREFLRWIRAGGQILPGLIARRECEQTFFRERLSLDNDGKFNRANCSSLGVASVVGDLIDIEVGEGAVQ